MRGCRRFQAARRASPVQDRQRQAEMVERAAAQVYRPSPPLSPASFDSAIAEIAARQNELDGPLPPRPADAAAQRAADGGSLSAADGAECRRRRCRLCAAADARTRAAPAGPDFSSLERHLLKITSQIEALQRPDTSSSRSPPSAPNLRISAAPLPRRCRARRSNSIENEIRSLSRRIDETRQSGTDGNVLANLERALGEIHEVLRSLKPAEQLAGYDDAIRNLGTKLDLILRANDDPSTVHQLEGAISAMRAIVSNVASNDALARVSDDVHALSAKVDQIARAGGNSESLRQPRSSASPR